MRRQILGCGVILNHEIYQYMFCDTEYHILNFSNLKEINQKQEIIEEIFWVLPRKKNIWTDILEIPSLVNHNKVALLRVDEKPIA